MIFEMQGFAQTCALLETLSNTTPFYRHRTDYSIGPTGGIIPRCEKISFLCNLKMTGPGQANNTSNKTDT